MHRNNDQNKNLKNDFFFTKTGSKFFFYFSLIKLTKIFKMNQSKKIFDQKKILAKCIVRPLIINYHRIILYHTPRSYDTRHELEILLQTVTYFVEINTLAGATHVASGEVDRTDVARSEISINQCNDHTVILIFMYSTFSL